MREYYSNKFIPHRTPREIQCLERNTVTGTLPTSSSYRNWKEMNHIIVQKFKRHKCLIFKSKKDLWSFTKEQSVMHDTAWSRNMSSDIHVSRMLFKRNTNVTLDAFKITYSKELLSLVHHFSAAFSSNCSIYVKVPGHRDILCNCIVA